MKKDSYYSIIIPVYNVENNIKKCIDSVLSQSFIDFELILVDDGSSDNSGVICEKYAEIDKRVIVIHQKNQGVSAARNEGMKKATGKYLVFIDGDDFVEKDILKKLNQSDADFVLVGFSEYSDNKVIKTFLDDEECWQITSDEGIKHFLNTQSSIFVWGKRYKKSIIDAYNIRFRCNLKFSEDMIFNNDYILKAKTIVNVQWPGYYYCQYKSETLSSIADKTIFIERTRWRKIAYDQFSGHPAIQKIYVSQMLYFAEKEIVKLSNKKEKLAVKREEIKEIISDDFFQFCIKSLPETLPSDVKLFCRLRLITLLIFKYNIIGKKSNVKIKLKLLLFSICGKQKNKERQNNVRN